MNLLSGTPMRLPALASLLCLLGAAVAAEAVAPAPPAPPSVLVDNSRSSAAARDRVRFLAGAVLPKEARTFAFDREVRAGELAALPFNSRFSDYLKAAETVAGQPAGALVVVVGDGLVEVVHPAMPPAYLAGLPADADRLAINDAVAKKAVAAFAEQAKRVRLVALVPAAERGIWAQVPGPELRSLARLADLVELARACRTLPAGEALTDPAARADNGRVALDITEGCTALTLWINLPGDPAAAEMALVDRAGGKPLAGGVETVAGGGALRALRVTGLEAGAALELRATGAGGAALPLEVLAVQSVAIRHRMTAAPEAGLAELYSGEKAAVTHRFLRAPGDTPVSPALDKTLRAAMALTCAKAPVADPALLALPAKGGSAELAASFAAPWAARVATQPLALRWTDTEPLRVAVGFSLPEAYDGTPVGVRAQTSGGRRANQSIAISLQGPDGRKRPLSLVPEGGVARAFAATVAFTAEERGRWEIDAKAGATGSEPGQIAAPAQGTSEHLVTKDWRLLIALGVLALLALIALWLWWYLTRPRWRAELLRHAGGDTRLKEVPGPKARDTSRGLPSFGHEVLFTKGRLGVTLTVKEGAQVWLNARLQTGSCELPPGSDIEVAGATGRTHARFFASPEQAAAWTHEQALIAPGSGEDELFVVDEGGAPR